MLGSNVQSETKQLNDVAPVNISDKYATFDTSHMVATASEATVDDYRNFITTYNELKSSLYFVNEGFGNLLGYEVKENPYFSALRSKGCHIFN